MPIVVVGKVTNTKDPQGLGRVQVKLQGYANEVEVPWMRLVGSYASNGFGAVLLPEKDDEVLVLKGDGENSDQMVCLGSVYNGGRKPHQPDSDGENNIKALKTRAGNLISISDKSGEESVIVSTPDEKLSIKLDHPSGTITITGKDKIHLSCSSGQVVVECQQAKVSASGSVSVEAPQISLSGNVSLG